MNVPTLQFSLAVAGILGGGTLLTAPSMSQDSAEQGNPSSVPTPRTDSGQPDMSGRWGGLGGGGTGVLDLNPGTATYLEDPPCLDFDAAHMVTRERG